MNSVLGRPPSISSNFGDGILAQLCHALQLRVGEEPSRKRGLPPAHQAASARGQCPKAMSAARPTQWLALPSRVQQGTTTWRRIQTQKALERLGSDLPGKSLTL